ncbi:HNH endonuclease [Croceibacterium ferulae]|uniref:HNH endonuclease n=1 Tax=Croceibacterium ferulae TaxID=1854641 RepID=UPI000EB4E758|nr:HNH endonuclease signature motif containing protein [Croceibacterium ferulae]
MSTLDGQMALTNDDHLEGLRWFVDHTGSDVPWPAPLPSGLYLVNKAKGIHKPKGWDHALSVRQSLSGPYEDREVEVQSDGSWRFDYYQEGNDPSNRDDDYTNRALVRNMLDGIPVGVLIQVKSKPNPRYRVMGLAQVSAWAGGYFRLNGFSPSGELGGPEDASAIDKLAAILATEPIDTTDARRRINIAIVARQGTGAFRKAALQAFQGRCVITGYDVPEVLEAAHIVPYLGVATNVLTNTLLLRADIHTLFDRGLLSVCADTLKVQLAPSLKTGIYGDLDGSVVKLPAGDPTPWKTSLKQRRDLGSE